MKRTRIHMNQSDVCIASAGEPPQIDPITVGRKIAVGGAKAVVAPRGHFSAYLPERGIT